MQFMKQYCNKADPPCSPFHVAAWVVGKQTCRLFYLPHDMNELCGSQLILFATRWGWTAEKHICRAFIFLLHGRGRLWQSGPVICKRAPLARHSERVRPFSPMFSHKRELCYGRYQCGGVCGLGCQLGR
ncbi:hypothetical protein IscW_ISCW017524 [Ixodes scapularis]|uniref:Uncharacterized protein n=1 Tax=Ixodes scapularis TaxID=6945 RepID=B7PB21_IXOSC|nr:hypothetical protein IscW_ISCW017524 [Ixodes scapularis]|eukprot:XP_002407632.1 hypothetical protein IscW_ISCW017524 [Ixodes scapularis]